MCIQNDELDLLTMTVASTGKTTVIDENAQKSVRKPLPNWTFHVHSGSTSHTGDAQSGSRMSGMLTSGTQKNRPPIT